MYCIVYAIVPTVVYWCERWMQNPPASIHCIVESKHERRRTLQRGGQLGISMSFMGIRKGNCLTFALAVLRCHIWPS